MYKVFAMDADLFNRWFMVVWVSLWPQCPICFCSTTMGHRDCFVSVVWYIETFIITHVPMKGEGADIPSGHISVTGSAHLDMSGQRLEHLTFTPDQSLRYLIPPCYDLESWFCIIFFTTRIYSFFFMFLLNETLSEIETYLIKELLYIRITLSIYSNQIFKTSVRCDIWFFCDITSSV